MKPSEALIQEKLVPRYLSLERQRFYHLYQEYWHSVLLQDAPDKPEGLVLDCGSGSGRLLSSLCRIYDQVFGLDLSLEMLQGANISESPHGVLASRAQAMALKDDAFGLVICKSSLHHIPKPAEALREINRILKENGILIISEPCRDNFLWRIAGRAYTGVSKRFSEHHHLFRSRQIQDLLAQNGFEIQTIRYFGLVGFPLCGAAQQLPILKSIPGNQLLARFLIKIDELFIRLPIIRSLRWHIIIQAKKSRRQPGGGTPREGDISSG